MSRFIKTILFGLLVGLMVLAVAIVVGTLVYAFVWVLMHGGVIAFIVAGCFLIGIVYAIVDEYLSENTSNKVAKAIYKKEKDE